MTKGWVLVLGALGAVAIAVGVQLWPDRSLHRVREAQVLRIGYAVEAPFAYVDERGEVTGEFPETARRIAQRMGFARVVWVQTAFASLVPDLKERRFDLICSLLDTPERRELVSFAAPLMRVSPTVMVAPGNPHHLAAYEQMQPYPGARIAVLYGSTPQRVLAARGFTPEMLVLVPDSYAASLALLAGTVHAAVLAQPTARLLQAEHAQAQELLSPSASSQVATGTMAFAFHPEDAALREAWNLAQAGYLSDPQHQGIDARFGFAAADVILPMTLAAAGSAP